MQNLKNKFLKWYYKTEHFVVAPNKAYEEYNKYFKQVQLKCDNRLQSTIDIPKISIIYDWKIDKTNFVKNFIERWKRENVIDNNTYPICKRWMDKPEYKETITKNIKDAITQSKGNIINLK